MGRTNKYLSLLLLLVGGLLAAALVVFILVYLLRLFAGVVSAIPGSDTVYRLLVTLVPYLIYLLVYYSLFRHNHRSKGNHWGRKIAPILMCMGVGICLLTGTLAIMSLYGSKHPWAVFFDSHSYLGLTAQILLLFFTTLFMALAGEEK